MTITPTMQVIRDLLRSGKSPFHGASGRRIGGRAKCLYAMQKHGLVDAAKTKNGWKLTPKGLHL